jgi:glycosyltransferase involved in cell wall biosynthesis
MNNNSFGCSIVIASYNRAQLLGETLESLLRENTLDSCNNLSCELIIVNNNSTDDTSTVAQKYASRFKNASVHFEHKQGLSHARNAGVQAAKGEIVVFLDDDVEVAGDWLSQLLQPFSNPQIAVVGGKVLPFGTDIIPDWLPREYAFLASVFDPSDLPCEIAKVMGANFAVRHTVLNDVGVFDPKLGRKGNKLLGGEEVELFKRITDAGHRVWYTPYSVVWHKIANKLKHEYMNDYAYWLGVSDAFIDKTLISKNRFILKYIRSAIFPWSVYPLQSLFSKNIAEPTRQIIKKQYSRGYLAHKRELMEKEN